MPPPTEELFLEAYEGTREGTTGTSSAPGGGAPSGPAR
ncbi:hypothetical protein FHX39_003944 [Friedmanniella antarctica]|uniref:Uncharacterized protein n=1 Tax=Microlunatus antarcticus TaxID=53388 RepID=A0A7W5JZ12_9ACTN|nr:hypothetical protein [Microlunatus antarcticus]